MKAVNTRREAALNEPAFRILSSEGVETDQLVELVALGWKELSVLGIPLGVAMRIIKELEE